MSSISGEESRLQIIKKFFFSDWNFSSSLTSTIKPLNCGMDDAALIEISDEDSMVVASDFIRGSKFYLFELGYLNYFDIGYYLVVANLSDIAAIGANPIALNTIIRYEKELTDEQFTQILEGIKTAADKFRVRVIGGDIGGHNSNVLAATAIGFMKTKDALLRKNVRDGDLLCVTGSIGLPITALIYFKKAKSQGFIFHLEEEEKLLESWKRPTARVTEGLLLSQNSIANACQDISDGLKATINQMSAASGKYFTIFSNKLPVDEITEKLATFLNVSPVQIALSASVDFELLFTMPASKHDLCASLFQENGCSYSVIGEVNSLGKNVLLSESGEIEILPGVAWNHQNGDFLRDIVSSHA